MEMETNRLRLHAILSDLYMETLGCNEARVYFQPEEGFKMEFPCVVYSLDNFETVYANNKPYFITPKYSVTVIDRDPESPVAVAMTTLPTCKHDRRFVVDNLYHDNFTIY